MRVELFQPDSDTEPRHWVRHDQAFAMMLGPGLIEWGSKRSAPGASLMRRRWRLHVSHRRGHGLEVRVGGVWRGSAPPVFQIWISFAFKEGIDHRNQ